MTRTLLARWGLLLRQLQGVHLRAPEGNTRAAHLGIERDRVQFAGLNPVVQRGAAYPQFLHRLCRGQHLLVALHRYPHPPPLTFYHLAVGV